MTYECTQYHRPRHFQIINYMVYDTQINEAELMIRLYQENRLWGWRDGLAVKELTALSEDMGLVPRTHRWLYL